MAETKSNRTKKSHSKLPYVRFFSIIIILIAFFIAHKAVEPYLSNKDIATQPHEKSNTALNSNTLFGSKIGARYKHSRPSNGPMTKTQDIQLTNIQENIANITLQAKEASPIEENRSVFLFDSDNNRLPVIAKVISVTPNNNSTAEDTESPDKIDIRIALPKDLDLNNLSPTAKVITMKSIVSPRLPYSALQFDSDKTPYIWLTEKTNKEGQYKAVKKPLNTVFQGDLFFSPGLAAHGYSYFITNPDKALKQNETYKFEKEKIIAPNASPLRAIKLQKQLNEMKKRNIYNHNRYLACIEKSKKKVRTGASSTAKNSESEAIAACSSLKNEKPMDLINRLINKAP